jgi:hypothetical protein
MRKSFWSRYNCWRTFCRGTHFSPTIKPLLCIFIHIYYVPIKSIINNILNNRYPFLANDKAATSLTQCLAELAHEAALHSDAHAEEEQKRAKKANILEEQVRVKEAKITELSERINEIESISLARDDESLLSNKITAALEEQVRAQDTQISKQTKLTLTKLN